MSVWLDGQDTGTGGIGAWRILLRGVGQIFLQNHAGAGLCFLLALAAQSWMLAIGCLLGAWVATQWGLRYAPAAECAEGLHGYNGALVGIGVLVALSPGPWTWALVAVLSVVATWLANCWRRRLPGSPYTGPFIVMIWLVLMVLPFTDWTPTQTILPATFVDGPSAASVALLRGVGQVMFLDNPWAGALSLLGLCLSAPSAAVRALAASTLALSLAWLFGLPADAMYLGLYGFNAVLLVEALHQALPVSWLVWRRPPPGGALDGFGGSGTAWSAWAMLRYGLMLLAGVLLSLVLMRAFQLFELPALTAPFVLGTWILRVCLSFGLRHPQQRHMQ